MKPPTLADWVLRTLIPSDTAGDIIGDLHEEFARFKLEELGPAKAELWYLHQALSVALRYARIRLPHRSHRPLPGLDYYGDSPGGLTGLSADLKGAFRRLSSSPGYSLAVVATLALGIGVASAVFSAVDGVLLEPLPYEEPQDLVVIEEVILGVEGGGVGASPQEFRAFRDHSAFLGALAATWPTAANLTRGSGPMPLSAALVTPSFFSVLGVEPAQGRVFRPGEAEGGVGYVGVLSDSAWRRLFDSDPGLVGKQIVVDGDPMTVVGIMPPAFRHPGDQGMNQVDIWVPMDLREGGPFDNPRIRDLGLVGRLRDGATLAGAREELGRIAETHRQAHPEEYPLEAEWSVSVDPLQDQVVGDAGTTLLLLFGSAALVLIAVISNIANLQVSHGASRVGEFALRAALGGSRARITRWLFTESLLLGLMGAMGGMGIAVGGTNVLRGLVSREFPRLDRIEVDGTTLVFLLSVSIVSAVAFGLLPAIRYSRTPAIQVMERKALRGAGRRSSPRRTVVGIQTAVSVVLFVGAGLLLKSYGVLGRLDPGFEPDHVLTMATWLPIPNDPGAGAYVDPGKRIRFFDEALERMARLPGVAAAAVTTQLPLQGAFRAPVSVEGAPEEERRGPQTPEFRVVSEDYFRAMGIALLAGREFRRTDDLGSRPVAMVSQAFVDRYFHGADPIGKSVGLNSVPEKWFEVVGVVEDVCHNHLGTPPRPAFYTSLRQNNVLIVSMSFALKTTDRPQAHVAAATRALQEVDPDIPTFAVATMDQVVSNARSRERLLTVFFGLLSFLTGTLAALGIYGVVSFAVNQRSRELGVRLALGGGKPRILRMLLGEGLALGLSGASVGLLLAAVLSRFLVSFLFGVEPGDPWIFTGAAALTLILVAVASLVPALAATRMDPAQTIRAD